MGSGFVTSGAAVLSYPAGGHWLGQAWDTSMPPFPSQRTWLYLSPPLALALYLRAGLTAGESPGRAGQNQGSPQPCVPLLYRMEVCIPACSCLCPAGAGQGVLAHTARPARGAECGSARRRGRAWKEHMRGAGEWLVSMQRTLQYRCGYTARVPTCL